MRKSLVIVLLAFVFCVGAFAQDNKAEVFGGYQYTNIDNNGSSSSRVSLNGWDAALTGYLSQNFGITADISGAYGKPTVEGVKIDSTNHFFLFGPTVKTNLSNGSVFAHALFGVAHAKGSVAGISTTDNAFSMALGGGLDVRTGKNVSIRVGQFDYLLTKFNSTNQNNFRYSAGLVFHF